jgi:hypothetical protein
LICSPMRFINEESSQFCKSFGFSVGATEDESCFNGFPSVNTYGKAKSKAKPTKNKAKKEAEGLFQKA